MNAVKNKRAVLLLALAATIFALGMIGVTSLIKRKRRKAEGAMQEE